MIDLKSEIQQLVDTYPLQDGMTRLQLAEQLEKAFFDRLQTTLILSLSDEDKKELFTDEDLSPDKFFENLYSMVDDIDDIIEETFSEFKQEFLNEI